MKFKTKGFLALLAMFFIFSLTGGHLKAQYTYQLIDTTDDIDDTYDSTTLIASDLSVTATTANSDFDLLDFKTDALPPISRHPEIVVAEATPQLNTSGPVFDDVLIISNGTGQDYGYFFGPGTFQTLGSYDSTIFPSNPSYSEAEIIISAVPEPGTWYLPGMGMIALFVLAARQRTRFGLPGVLG